MLGLDLRTLTFPCMAGLALGSALWLAVGQQFSVAPAVAALTERLTSKGGSHFVDRSLPTGGKSLFGQPGSAPPLAIKLVGIAKSPRRTAALLEINGRPGEWVPVGDSRDGFTLLDVGASRITIETTEGDETLLLGQISTPGQPKPETPPSSEVPPKGYRMPPPPVDAPRP